MKTIQPGVHTSSKLGKYRSISGADFMGHRLDFYKQVWPATTIFDGGLIDITIETIYL